MRVALLLPVLALAVACPGSESDPKDTSGGSETGEIVDIDHGPPGCINLNGVEGDFDSIMQAVGFSLVGDTVNVCAGSYTEGVVVDVGVHIVGEGSATTFIDAPTNEPAFDILGDGGSVSGFTITSTRSGVTVDGAADVSLSDLVFNSPANYGIEANAATNLTVSAATFLTPVYGGIFLSGGSATVDSSVFTEATSYGIWATGDAQLIASNNIFDRIRQTSTDGSDGFAIFGDGATVAMSHNVVTTGDLVGVLVSSGALTLDGDLFMDTPYGVYASASTFSADGVVIYGATTQGIVVTTKSDVTLTNTAVQLNGGETQGLASCSNDYSAFNGQCGGVYIEADSVVIDNLAISDYESFGAFVAPARNNGSVEATVSNVTIDNVGRWGFYITDGTATFDALSITGLREPDTSQVYDCTYEVEGSYYTSVDRGAGLLVYNGDATVTNSTFAGSEGWGLSAVNGTATVSSSLFSGAVCSGIINFQSGMTVLASTFSQPAEQNTEYGMIFDYQGAIVVEGNTFVDTKAWYISEYDDGLGGVDRYVQSGAGRDFITNGSTGCLIKDNTFTGGDNSLDIEMAGCDITGNTWSGYNGTILATYMGTESDPVRFSGNTVLDHAGYIVYSTYGTTSVEDLTVGDLGEYAYSYSQTNIAADGTEVVGYSYAYSYGQQAFYAYGSYSVYDSDLDGVAESETLIAAGLKLENISIGAAIGGVVSGYNASIEITDVQVESASGNAVYGYWAGGAPEVEIDGLEIAEVTGSGIALSAYTKDDGYALLSDIAFDTVSGTAVSITGFSEWSMEDVSIVDAGGYGVTSNGSYSYIMDYSTYTYVYGTREPLVSISGVEIDGATYDAFAITNGIVSIDSSAGMGGDADGVTLDSVSASITNNIFAVNVGYGMTCSNTVLDVCSGNDLSANTRGTHLDCSDDCSL